MMVAQRVYGEAREAVIEARFRGGPAPVNPYRRDSRSHMWWDMGLRKAERIAAELQRVGG